MIPELACGLVGFDRSEHLVSLAHFSIKTFLTSDWIKTSAVSGFHLDEGTSNSTIMHTCLKYLMLPTFSNPSPYPH